MRYGDGYGRCAVGGRRHGMIFVAQKKSLRAGKG